MPKRFSVALLASAIGAALLIGTVYAMTRTQPMSFDAQFIDMMVPHHQGAVEMAKIAQQRAEHPEIAQMAEAIITAQESEIGQMKAWRLAWFGSDETPPMERMPMVPGMGGGHAATVAAGPWTWPLTSRRCATRPSRSIRRSSRR